MKALRLQISFSLLYLAGMLFAPVFGMEAHHCGPHAGQGNHTDACPRCSRECMPETPLEHVFEEALAKKQNDWVPLDSEFQFFLPRVPDDVLAMRSRVVLAGSLPASAYQAGSNALARAPPRS